MINLHIHRTEIRATDHEALVEGNRNSILLHFDFSPEWTGLTRVAAFSNGSTKVSVTLTGSSCAIPWEVLVAHGDVYVSVRGVGDGGEFILCTKGCFLGRVAKSAASSPISAATAATPNVIDTLLADVAELQEEMESAGGTSGTNGKSAYELAVENGYSGTVAQWLASLHGADGTNGTNGTNGADGTDGANGADGADGADGTTFTPAVSSAGVISWSNDGGKPNPQSVDLVAAVLAALPVWEGGSY